MPQPKKKSTSGEGTGDSIAEPAVSSSSPTQQQQGAAIREGSQNDGGDAQATDTAETARLPKQLRRLQSILDRIGNDEEEKHIDAVLHDYQALCEKYAEFCKEFTLTKLQFACLSTNTHRQKLLYRLHQADFYLGIWRLGAFDLESDDAPRFFSEGIDDFSKFGEKYSPALTSLGLTLRPKGGRGHWNFSEESIFSDSDLSPGPRVIFELLHCMWDAVESTEAWLKLIAPIYRNPKWKEDPKEQSRPKGQSHYQKFREAQDLVFELDHFEEEMRAMMGRL